MIELLAEAEQRRLRECASQAAADFGNSVRAIYGSSSATERLPQHVGSCILLDIDGTRVVSTAAHIADETTHGGVLFIAGPVRLELVPMLGSIKATAPPGGNRNLDHSDCAFWRVPDGMVEDLGAANFLDTSRLSQNRAPHEDRYYAAFGYTTSRNAERVDHIKRTITAVPSMHAGNAVLDPALARKLHSSDDQHIFVRFAKKAEDEYGAKANVFHPKGFSGGALLDLGDFTSPEIYAGGTKDRARLAGMIIEYHKEHRALVAVKIGPIVEGIRKALRGLPTVVMPSPAR